MHHQRSSLLLAYRAGSYAENSGNMKIRERIRSWLNRGTNVKMRSEFFLTLALRWVEPGFFSEGQLSERVISHGNTHEYQVVYGHGFVVHRALGEISTFDTGNHVEAGDHQLAVYLLFPR